MNERGQNSHFKFSFEVSIIACRLEAESDGVVKLRFFGLIIAFTLDDMGEGAGESSLSRCDNLA